jgi:hypothetical protein
MQITLIMTLYHRKSIQTWVLLADNQVRHDGNHHRVQRLLVLPEANSKACKSSSAYRSLLAFSNLGIDIVGLLPRAPGGFRFLFIIIDTFTKWMEAMLVVNIM